MERGRSECKLVIDYMNAAGFKWTKRSLMYCVDFILILTAEKNPIVIFQNTWNIVHKFYESLRYFNGAFASLFIVNFLV